MSRFISLFALLAMLLLTTAVWAQPEQLYDPKTVVTIQGQVESLESTAAQGRRGASQLLRLKTAEGTVLVHLGPADALAQQNFAPKKGDNLTITGSKLTTGQGPIILAAEVKAGDKTITLRDAQGRPTWQGQGMRSKARFYGPQAPPSAPPR
ncbi:MAG: hypothetical protein ACUVRZ_06175 [Desulfobacca sp.]|uniref:hypothetical protein n=1 Tax=Desulfobacca sp. TaxID=2067990 RepID=UPI00404B5E6F